MIDVTKVTPPNAENFLAICGFGAYGEIELWTRDMRIRKEDPIGLGTAEEAYELIREQVMR